MKLEDRAIRLGLTLCLSLTLPALTQTSNITEATAPAITANVYVQVAKGVNVYNATAAGKLTLVKGSPFAVAGQMEGHNGKYLISVGTTIIHSYAIIAKGAIGKQVSTANTQSFGGSECTTGEVGPNFAVFDHTGKYLYIQLYTGWGASCSAWQTYQISSSGQLAFLGDIQYETYGDNYAMATSLPTISGSNNFAYGILAVRGVSG